MRKNMLWACSLMAGILAVAVTVTEAADPAVAGGEATAGHSPAPAKPILLDEISLGQLRPLPPVTEVRQFYPDGWGGTSGVAAVQIVEDPDPIYSNTFGQEFFSHGIPNVGIADDLVTEAIQWCAMTTFKIRVNGGVEDGDGEFAATISLWDGCPYGSGDIIEDTTFTFTGLPDNMEITPELVMRFHDRGICTDGSDCLVSLQNCGDGSVCEEHRLNIPPEVWVQVSFDTEEAGVIVGTPAQRGYSADAYDHPYGNCVSWFRGYPLYPHASFWAEVYASDDCARHHLAYLAADATEPAWLPGGSLIRMADDIELIYGPNDNTTCRLSAYELGIVGNAGPYRMEIALTYKLVNDENDPEHCSQENSMCARTKRVFRGRGEGSLEVARFAFLEEEIAIGPNEQPIYIIWRPNRSNTGVPNVRTALAGSSLPVFFMEDYLGNPGWEAYAIPTGRPAVFYAAVYCKGYPPRGACCPPQPAEPNAEMICYDDLTVLSCLGSRWLINSTCEENRFTPPCGTHACCKPDDNCSDLTYDDCVSICDTELDPIACRNDEDCPGLRECHDKECHNTWGFTGIECTTADDCEPGETCEDFGYCGPSCSRWGSGEYCGEGEQRCFIFQCYDAGGDCFDVDEPVVCDEDWECPDGRHCMLPDHICSARLGCRNVECCDAVCRDDFGDYCCDVGWDDTCVSLAEDNCEIPPGNDDCWGSRSDEGTFPIELKDPSGDPCLPGSSSCTGSTSAFNAFATTSPEDPLFCCATAGAESAGLGTLWYKFIAAHPSARIHTCSSGGWSGQDTILQVFRNANPDLGICDNYAPCNVSLQNCADGSPCELDERSACGNLINIGCNDDYPVCGPEDRNSSVCVTGLVPGQTYYIQMGSPSGFNLGNYDLDIQSPCPQSHLPPGNNDCETAANVSSPGTDFILEGASFDCPSESELPMMTNDVWYTYIANCTGNVTVQTCSPDMPEGENPETTLAVYQGLVCPPTTLVASNDDATIEKHCTIDRKTCNEDADCIFGCTGPGPHTGQYCETDDDCPGTSVCDLTLQHECSISGDLCAIDSDCHLGVCEHDMQTPCNTTDTTMQCRDLRQCTLNGQSCSTDGDCIGYCSISYDPCTMDSDCPDPQNETCVDYRGTCDGDSCEINANCMGTCDRTGAPCEMNRNCPEYETGEICENYRGTCDPPCGRDFLGDPYECIPIETCEVGMCLSDCEPASSLTFPTFPGGYFMIRVGGKFGSYPEGFLSVECVSDDCNNNGQPDLFEIENGSVTDCNFNGEPDVCDVNPADPDGNGLVSPDCDGNGWPDECQIRFDAQVDCTVIDPCYGGPFFCYGLFFPCDQDLNENGIPDACDCMDGAVSWVNPPNGMIDARQPHGLTSAVPAHGMDSFVAQAPGIGQGCWSLCETAVSGSPNVITDIVDNGNNTVTITLDRPITAGALTELTYTSATSVSQTGQFWALPGDTDGNKTCDPADIDAWLGCMNSGVCAEWQTDINRSGVTNAQDLLRLIDLLNGAHAFTAWNGQTAPTECP